MLFERIESRGLAHYSYLIGELNAAVVIDPRRDCQEYMERAAAEGMRITDILETHRHEDFAVGSVELSSRTGAAIWHADSALDYRYGRPVEDGQSWKVGRLALEALHTPGHTPGSMSYLLRDAAGAPWMVFTGDALFSGDVGRVDLLGMDRAEEMAGMLYHSIFRRLLPLGDGVLVCPAHGSGSVCGTSIADRPWTTLGMERMHNPRLQVMSGEEFASLVAVELERPPYFRRMEALNIQGAPLSAIPLPPPLSPKEFAREARDAVVVDTRMEIGYGAAHVPSSQFIWHDGLASFAGWLLPYDRPLLLVSETNNPEQAVRTLLRLGYDDFAGFLAGSMLSWHMAGLESASIQTITVQELCRRLAAKAQAWILDVRAGEELARAGRIEGAVHIHVTRIPERMQEVPKDRRIYIFCGSGMRSMVAASWLKGRGWKDLVVVLGGLAGWKSLTCPIVQQG
ncbi:MAG: MBL fold metallo-hydrolase [Methanosarcinales archaeon]|nr:MBL fold metallo-hydrolase [Methanosarcinales archaeon]